MQDVSCEPLMLCPSENPQANLDIFSQPHHHPSRVLHPSQGDKQGLTFPFLWRTALQAEFRVWAYPGTPPPSVYQVTHGTALQAAECNVQHLSCTYSIRGLPHAR